MSIASKCSGVSRSALATVFVLLPSCGSEDSGGANGDDPMLTAGSKDASASDANGGNDSATATAATTSGPPTAQSESGVPPSNATSDGTGGNPTVPSSGGNSGGADGMPTAGGGGSGPGGAPGLPSGGGGTGGSDEGSAGASGATNGGAAGEGSPLAENPVVYVGGFDYGGDAYPLSIYDLDKATGTLTRRSETVDAGPNPSYITVSPSRTHLYVANERDDDLGGLTAAAIGGDGSLSVLNHQTGSDGGYTHVAVDPSGRYAFGAAYNGGNVAVFPIEADGSLGAEVDNVDFGDGAQSHCVGFDATGSFVFVPNKGANMVAELVLGADGTLTDNTPPSVDAAEPGAGPRHFALHPSGDLAFVINENDSTMTPYQVGSDGTLTPGTTLSTLPADMQDGNTGAHVEVSPDGAYVYGSNRGHDSIVVFSTDPSSGALTLVGHTPTGGSTPRDFDVDPQGDFLIVAHQNSASLGVLRIEGETLTAVGEAVEGPPNPSAVQFVYLDGMASP